MFPLLFFYIYLPGAVRFYVVLSSWTLNRTSKSFEMLIGIVLCQHSWCVVKVKVKSAVSWRIYLSTHHSGKSYLYVADCFFPFRHFDFHLRKYKFILSFIYSMESTTTQVLMTEPGWNWISHVSVSMWDLWLRDISITESAPLYCHNTSLLCQYVMH